MNTFRPPVSPAHIFTAVGLAIALLFPGISPTVRLVIAAVIVVAYVIAETVYTSIRAHKFELPAISETDLLPILAALHANPQTAKILSQVDSGLADTQKVTQALDVNDLPNSPVAGTHAVYDDANTAIARTRALIAAAEARSASS